MPETIWHSFMLRNMPKSTVLLRSPSSNAAGRPKQAETSSWSPRLKLLLSSDFAGLLHIAVFSVLTVVQYSWCEPQTKEGVATIEVETNQQWCLPPFEQGNQEHAQALRTLRCLWVC